MKQFGELLGSQGVQIFQMIKLYAVEIGSTLVFVVFIAVETIRAIRHLIRDVRN